MGTTDTDADALAALARRARPLSRMSEGMLRALGRIIPPVAILSGRRLIGQGRLADAEELLARAVERFPRHAGLRGQFALAAQCDGRHAEAAERWSTVCASSPEAAMPWGGLAACRRALGDIPAARSAIGEALSRAPDETWIMTEAARIFDEAGEPARSVPFWARVVERPAAPAGSWQCYVEALLRLGRVEDADAALQRGFACHPQDRALVAASGSLAMRRDDWESAFDIWARYADLYPDDEIGSFHHERAATMLRLQRAERQQPAPPFVAPVAVDRVEDEATRTLLLGFESIGQDCELGTVQRRYGAEPLGLLRWNDVTFANLAAALEARFAGMGEPDVTWLDVGRIDEIYVRDRRWDLGMHTFLFSREVSLEALLPKMCRRLAYLRDKFLQDLATGGKILVFKTDDVSIRELEHLHALLEDFGPTRLLHVRRGAWAGVQGWPRAATGEVAALAPGLAVGYLSRISRLEDIVYDEWVAVCRAAAAMLGSVERQPEDGLAATRSRLSVTA